MTEDPRGRGYPDLGTPATRVTTAWRLLWQTLLVNNVRKARTAQQALNEARRVLGRARR